MSKLLSGAERGLFALALTVFSGTVYSQTTYTFNFTGSTQTISLPAGSYSITCWGADGGDATNGTSSLLGGKGGFATGIFANPSTATFNIYVGGKGGNASAAQAGGGGGGMSDVAPASNTNIIIIAAGGGGGSTAGGTTSENSIGGDGGGLNGGVAMDGSGVTGGSPATGGSQSAGGVGTAGTYGLGTPGGFGYGGGGANGGTAGSMHAAGGSGGNGGTGGWNGGGGGSTLTGINDHAAGGGAGYYGGGGGRGDGGAGGGGSGFIGGVTSGTTIMLGQPGFVANPDGSGNGLVLIRSLCDVNLAASSNPICNGAAVTLSTNAGSNISWSTGPTTSSIVVSPSTTTSYTVSGVSSSSTACTATLVITVSVNPLPQVTTAVIPPVICAGNSATVLASGGINYTFMPSGVQSPSVVLSPGATSVYSLTGEDHNGCTTTNTFAVEVINNVLPVSGNTTICEGSSAHLSAFGANSYMWSNGSIFANTTVHPFTTTTYFVNGVDGNGCTLSNSITVNVNSLPSIALSAANTVVCRGEPVVLSVFGASTYSWAHGGSGNTSSPIPTIDVPTVYMVTGTGTNGCTSTASIQIDVRACVGIEEMHSNTTLSIYPNPGNGIYKITGANSSGAIIVSDVSGRVILKDTLPNNDAILDLSAFNAGIYYVNINGQTVKVLKE